MRIQGVVVRIAAVFYVLGVGRGLPNVGSVQIYRPALWYFRPFLARHEGGHLSAQTLRIRAYRRSLHCLAFPVEAKDVKKISPPYYFTYLYICDYYPMTS